MEGFMFSPYNFSGYPGCGPILHGNPKLKPYNFAKKGGLYMTPDALDYLDMCKRVQLKAILSQVNPGLIPRHRTANTKEFGVQVNAKVDAIIQCSLGPKTLFYRERQITEFRSPVKPAPLTPNGKNIPSTPVNNVRFSRPLAIYSPVFDRRFLTKSMKSNNDSANHEGGEDVSRGSDEEEAEADQTIEHEGVPEEQRKDVSKPQHPESKGYNFQFLEQRYGFFHCGKCNIRWESAYVWCISGTSKVYFKQLCRKCQEGSNPYRVEDIQCQECSQTRCCCERKQRHIDLRRPHRQELCGRCRGKRLSCDTTYSFKYIV
ncbi:ZAR1-like protein [Osmerus eperlanus]|uniref:ZAR1-like protein n=1 Tax=Osmerus eperlanus TaxID=29151 RepID=UPI002E0DB3A2